jgi:hypothetical protein
MHQMNSINLLKIAYAANILILVPVVSAMFADRGVTNVFDGRVDESLGLRLLVASLWSAILLGSIAGLWWPRFFAALLPIQIIYKSLWLALFVMPLAQRSGWDAVPKGISITFLIIVLTYPFILWFALRGPDPA